MTQLDDSGSNISASWPPAPQPWREIAHLAAGRFKAQQNIRELAATLAYVDMWRPRVVVEIGTADGGSAWAWAQLPTVARVISVDRTITPLARGMADRLAGQLVLVEGDSTDPATVATVANLTALSAVGLVVIDGGHDYATALHDWTAYTDLAAPGALAVVHDTQGYPGNDTVQVPQLWAQLVSERPTLELVSHPGGPWGTGIVWLPEGFSHG